MSLEKRVDDINKEIIDEFGKSYKRYDELNCFLYKVEVKIAEIEEINDNLNKSINIKIRLDRLKEQLKSFEELKKNEIIRYVNAHGGVKFDSYKPSSLICDNLVDYSDCQSYLTAPIKKKRIKIYDV